MKIFGLYLMSLLYVAAGFNHFYNPKVYRRIMPPAWPRPGLCVALSGGAEILLGFLLLWPRLRAVAAWGIIALLVSVFPANLYMYRARETSFKKIPGWILALRLPLQALLVMYAYVYTS